MPSQIEAFFDYNEPLENMVLSGGASTLRNRAITRIIDIATSKNYFTLLLHCGDKELEDHLKSNASGYGMYMVNTSNPIYDPFFGKSGKEISRMIYDSSTRNYRLRADSKYYIEGIYEYLTSRRVMPCLYMYATCPHLELLNKISEAEKQRVISRELASRITSMLIQGKSQLPDIENFLSALVHQGKKIFASPKEINASKVVNLAVAAKKNKLLTMDVLMDNSDVLMNIIINEVEYLIGQGKRVLLILDGISPVSCDMLKKYLNKNNSNCSIVLSGEDVFSSFGGEERTFFPSWGNVLRWFYPIMLLHIAAISGRIILGHMRNRRFQIRILEVQEDFHSPLMFE